MHTYSAFRDRRPARRQRRGKTRLLLEVLEDRTVMSAALQAFTQTEVLAAVRVDNPVAALASLLADQPQNPLAGMIDLGASRELLTEADGTRVTQVALSAGADPLAIVAQLGTLPFVTWASPNLIHQVPVHGDPRDLTPNDPQYSSQYHHPLMKNNLAWDTTLGSPAIIIAVTDDGVSLPHQDLAANIWTNDDPINGIDDDANGFTDDLHGWDFSANDNDPNPPAGQSHGTHVAGIAAARTNNGIGVAGTSGGSTIMPVRFYGTGQWTSTVILNSYKYAVDNGAKIVSTSYNVDGFVNDPTFLSALNYLYNNGGMHFNSAGNNNQLNPPRQVFDHSLYVVSTDSADKKSSFSNYGFGVDISAPGSSILSTLPNNSYGFNSGTSMATPNAAGVAALIWSAHPTWTREQVAAQLIGTADNIDGVNLPQYAGLLGSGRVNAFRGVTETLKPPRIKSVQGLPAEGGTTTNPISAFSVDVANIFNPATVVIGNFELRGDGPDNAFDTPDDVVLPLSLPGGFTYRLGTNRLSFTVGGSMSPDTYRFRAVSGGLRDPFNTALDGNGDTVPGDHFNRTFTLTPVPPPPSAIIIDDGQTGYFEQGTWYDFDGVGFNNKERYTDPGSPNKASWQVTGVPSGTFNVWATWMWGNTNATYQIFDGAALRATVVVNQSNEPTGPSFGGRPFQPLGTNIVTNSGTVRVELLAAPPSGGWVLADAVRFLLPTPSGPVVSIVATDPDAAETVSGAHTGTFTVSRTGSTASALTVNYAISGTATNGGDYQMLTGTVQIPAGQVSAPIVVTPIDDPNPEPTETVIVTISPSGGYTIGDPSTATVNIADNDAPPPPPAFIIDNVDPGYSETGTWYDFDVGYNNKERYTDPGSPNKAIWQASGLAPGSYTVQATWMWGNADQAPYSIFDGSTPRGTVVVNQVNEPSGPSFGGRPFQTLGTFTINGGTIRVELGTDANEWVLADAIRVVAGGGGGGADGLGGFLDRGSDPAGLPGSPEALSGDTVPWLPMDPGTDLPDVPLAPLGVDETIPSAPLPVLDEEAVDWIFGHPDTETPDEESGWEDPLADPVGNLPL
jgi:subtilisin family serine protease